MALGFRGRELLTLERVNCLTLRGVVDKSTLFYFFLTILESRTINNQDWHLSQAKAGIYFSFIIGQ